MKRTVLIILIAAVLLCAYGCRGIIPAVGTETEEETTEEVTTEEVVTKDPAAVFKSKVHDRIARDAENICDQNGLSPGNMFYMSFSDALSKFVKPTKITIYSCEEALKSSALSSAECKKLLDSIGGLSSQNIYVYEFRGRIMQNPDIPYLLTDEATALRIALVYDDNAELYKHFVLEVSGDLERCVIIAVTSF